MEFTLTILGALYFIIGLLITFSMCLESGTFIPRTVGELVVAIIFLPFTVIYYLVFIVLYVIDKVFTPIVKSKWWNKEL